MQQFADISIVPDHLLDRFVTCAQAFSCFLILNDNNQDGSFTAALGCAKKLRVEQPGAAFAKLETFQAASKSPIFGYLSYDLKNELEDLHSARPDFLQFPAMSFFAPVYLFKYRAGKLHCSYEAAETSADKANNLLQKILNTTAKPAKPAPANFAAAMSHQEYLARVARVLEHIQKGDVYELNLCQEFRMEEASIDPAALYLRLNGLTTAPFSCFGGFDGYYVLSASPERFLQKKGKELTAQPIKGTAPRGKDASEDQQNVERLQNDPKERSENIMIVDLVRNDLSRIAEANSVEVSELCGIYTFKTVHQMISTVRANVRQGLSPVEVLKATFPMGSMTGAPKIRAMQLIEELEMSRRGLYSGAVGYITPDGDFDFNVIIRTLLYNSHSNRLSFQVGSAITATADPEKEYQECLLKAKALFSAVSEKVRL